LERKRGVGGSVYKRANVWGNTCFTERGGSEFTSTRRRLLKKRREEETQGPEITLLPAI